MTEQDINAVAEVVERILTRRIHQGRLDGYTLEAAAEIAAHAIMAYEKAHSPPPQEGLVEALEETRKIMREHQEAEDAMAIFIIEVDPKKIGEAAWQKQYRELSDRQRVTRQAFRTALSHHRAEPKPPPTEPEPLKSMLEAARSYVMTPEEVAAQRASWGRQDKD